MLGSLGTKLEKDGLLDKYREPKLNAVLVKEWSNLSKEFLKTLPYSLTPSQLSAVSEIIWDLKQPVPMNRLLQVYDFYYFILFYLFIFFMIECFSRKVSFELHFLVKNFLHDKCLDKQFFHIFDVRYHKSSLSVNCAVKI